MERKRIRILLLFFILSVSPFSFVTCRDLAKLAEQKNYQSTDPNAWSSPRHSSSDCQTPSPGGSGTSPSHGSGSHYSPPTTPHGGGSHYSPPTTPSHGGHGAIGGGGSGGCSCYTPPTTPLSPHVPQHPPNPTTPSPILPSVPITPSPLVPLNPPTISTPPPFIPDPNTPPFTCYYWLTHPTAIWVLFGYWGTIGQVFGLPPPAILPFGRNLSLLEALGNTRSDGFGFLLREGTASLLNSMATNSFYFNSQQVREGFNTAMRSEKMAEAQGKIFQKANEGRLKH